MQAGFGAFLARTLALDAATWEASTHVHTTGAPGRVAEATQVVVRNENAVRAAARRGWRW
eukprot:3174009-Alexandrium_andersonii.AAC.1